MSTSEHDVDEPLAEPGKRPAGASVGGVRATADEGLGDATQRSMERGDDPAIGRASTGDASGGAVDPRVDLGGKNEPGSSGDASARSDRPRSDDRATARPASRATGDTNVEAGSHREGDEDEDEWRHPPVEPVDEQNPLKSIGRSVADVVTGGAEDTSKKPER